MSPRLLLPFLLLGCRPEFGDYVPLDPADDHDGDGYADFRIEGITTCQSLVTSP